MKCVVTAGPTYEPLDEVRRLTNFSTGRLGSELASALTAAGHEVTLLVGQLATWRGERHAAQVETFTTTASLREKLAALAGSGIGAVFHAAAVSDFAFGQVWVRGEGGELQSVTGGKLSTRQGRLLAELVPTPKVIAALRGWFPDARLAGWKYEVDGGTNHACALARQQLSECRTDVCVVNGPAYGAGFGLVTGPAPPHHCPSAQDLYRALVAWLPATDRS